MTSSAPVLVGTGLICLDALIHDDDELPRLFAGGTSLNVLAHLQQRGWQTHLFGVIGNDRAGEYILRDLRELGFPTKSIRVDNQLRTPIYVERLLVDGHRFLRECPRCGAEFPVCPVPTLEQVDAFIASLPPRVDYCLIERAHPPAVRLAQACIQRGASLYLELNRPDDEASCHELIRLATVFKFAADRRVQFPFLDECPPAPLEIETLGNEGIRYRAKGSKPRLQPSTSCSHFVDAAGAGDAFSAELLSALVEKKAPPQRWSAAQLENALRRAQDVAALNCRFEGPRGGMYTHHPCLRADDFCCGAVAAYPPRLDSLPLFHENNYSLSIDKEANLRLLQEADAQSLFELVDANRAYLRKWMPWVDEASQPEGVLRFIRIALEHFEHSEEMHFAILHRGCIAGVIGTHRIDWENRRASMGYWVDRRRQGLGLVTRSVRTLTDFLFHQLGMNRIEIRCAAKNIRSQSIPQRLGFKNEGVLRSAQLLYGEYHNLVVYACLREEWNP